ncbi:MAG: isochorismatase family cysteine hydrolase, partial [Synergistota bacterium]|nr:isochorismatase family cysteine hydrolase [Synergistota bacterium]
MDLHTQPDFSHIALLTVDMQRAFLPGGAAPRLENVPIVDKTARLARAFRKTGLPVMHIVRIYEPSSGDIDRCRRKMVEEGRNYLKPGSDNVQIARGILPCDARLDTELLLHGKIQTIGEREYVIYKPRFGAFYRTPLEKHLRLLEVNTLAVAGSNFPNCPRATIYEAADRDFRLVVARDAVSLIDDTGARQIEAIGATVWSAHELARSIENLIE